MKTGLEGKNDLELLRVLRQGEAMQVAAIRAVDDGDGAPTGNKSWLMAARALVSLVHVEMTARVFSASMGARR